MSKLFNPVFIATLACGLVLAAGGVALAGDYTGDNNNDGGGSSSGGSSDHDHDSSYCHHHRHSRLLDVQLGGHTDNDDSSRSLIGLDVLTNHHHSNHHRDHYNSGAVGEIAHLKVPNTSRRHCDDH